ncbi:MAG TPA: chitobiase/beta-hexosaminidase C-terminal domain-containing protein [Planctomycetota bacterium]|nr:chitobiase/beta-hexosaminidase C-terminal domain-containing protein [Planctomycetota bacterium]
MSTGQTVILSELLALNESGLRDEDGDSSDWVEVHNSGPTAVSLAGWRLTDDEENPSKWVFPAEVLEPGGFLLVFASEKNRAEADAPLHASFRLDGDGEYLALVRPDGTVAHEYSPEYPPQVAGVSYGFLEGEARYFVDPTPGAANSGDTIVFVADTKFSVDRGFFDAPFDVAIETATPGATIRYTLDGTAPTESTGSLYTGPIRIDRTTPLRAAAFKEGHQPTNVDTQTYIFPEDVIRQPNNPPGYPAVWQPGWAADYEMDPQICRNPGSPVYYPTVTEDLKAIPTLSLALSPDDFLGPARGIYNHSESRGVAWERSASAELIFPDGSEEGFQVDCGLRMQGGASRDPVRQLKHSFRLLFKDEYGPTKLNYRLFKDTRVDSFNTIILRAFFTDGWATRYQEPRYRPDDSQYIRDLWMKDSQIDMGQPSGRNTYVHLYVNGLYWGLYNATERPDAEFQASHFGDAVEDWDVFKDAVEVMDGNRQAWDQLMSLAAGGLSTPAAYHRLQGENPDGSPNPAFPVLLDVDNLADYMILHIFGGAEDWPHHNWFAARRRGAASEGWRFLSWDQEIALDELSRNRTNVSNANSPAFVYSSLRQNPEFRLRFADRVQKHLFNGGALSTEQNRIRWMRRADQIDRAVVPESARWGDRRREPPFTRDVEWVREQRVVIDEYLPQIHPITMTRFRSAGLYPTVEPPRFSPHGGKVSRGFQVGVSGADTILYTLDGSDPRLEGGAISPSAMSLEELSSATFLVPGAPARYLVPRDAALLETWTQPGFDDSAWTPATTGIGYDRSGDFTEEIATDIELELRGVNGSIYIRVPFDAAEPAQYTSLRLRMKYDDGFVAYLNGTPVASREAPSPAAWNSIATGARPDPQALVFESMDISDHLDILRSGANVLAIHGLNASVSSSDFLIVPEIAAGSAGVKGVAIHETAILRARALSGNDWSALLEAAFYIDGPLPLRVTEIHYHPSDPIGGLTFDADDLEFIEVANVGMERVWLLGVRFTRGIEIDFSNGPIPYLEPGEAMVAVSNLEAFERVHGAGIPIAGEYDGRLDNGGETLRLEDPFGEALLEFAYDDAWHPETDGAGHSLVIVDARAIPDAWGQGAGWRASDAVGGTPGFHPLEPIGRGFQVPGDVNQDGSLDISDAVVFLRSLFLGGDPIAPCEGDFPGEGANLLLSDGNGDLRLDLSDAVYTLNHLFTGGPPHVLGSGCVRIEDCPDVCVP